jgi:Zn-dependent protease with chaperone function
MTHEEFVTMVERLEAFARREPGKYALRVGLLAALGYAFILLALAFVASLVLLLVWLTVGTGRFNFWVLKFGWVLAALAWMVGRALWVTIPAPAGVELRREQAPRLFALVDELTAALGAPRFHRVLVDDEYNAAVAQVPRLGPLGWYRNYLVLGLPLMQALSPEQFRAVLAHEIGHLSGNHGRFGGWIYRVRLTWYQLLTRIEQEQRWGSGLFIKFFNWYAPYFNAYSFVLARRHEYEADEAAARLTSPSTAAEALMTVEVKGSYLSEKFWPEVFRQAEAQAEPLGGTFAGMSRALRSRLAPQETSGLLLRVLSRETGYDDTHPSLAERLAALGFQDGLGPRGTAGHLHAGDAQGDDLSHGGNGLGARGGHSLEEIAPLAETAADQYLGDLQRELTGLMESAWNENIAAAWRERHEYANASKRRLAALTVKAAEDELTIDEMWERASLTTEFGTDDEAVPLLRAVVERRPHHAEANFSLGRILIGREDPEGVEHIERAMAAEPDAVAPGCQLLYGFFRERGQAEEAEAYRRRLFSHYDQLEEAGRERESYADGDQLEPHSFDDEQLERLRERLAGYEEVKAAYLARKSLRHFQDRPFHVLAVVPRLPWHRIRTDDADVKLIQRLITEIEFPSQMCVLVLDRVYRKTAKAVRRMDGALIYERR